MTDNEKTTGIPIEDDALENAAGVVTLPNGEDMSEIYNNLVKTDNGQKGYEVDREHSGSDINPLTGEPLLKQPLLKNLFG